jgi:tetratricopeptide (TPR) repeat protein
MEAGVKLLYRAGLLVWLAWAVTGGSPILRSQNDARTQALTLEQQGQSAEAEQAWRAIVAAHPHNAEALAHIGLMEARQEHYAEAARFYRRALAMNPAFPGLQMNLGLALFKGDQFKEAILPFASELRKHPGDQRLTILLGMAHYGMGDYAGAVPYLKDATDSDSQNLNLRLTLAQSCLWSKKFQCVLDDYKEILAINADSGAAHMMAGEALDGLGRASDAIQEFEAAAKVSPQEPNVHFGLGYLLWKQHRYDEAAREFNLELQNDPSHAQAMAYLGDTEIKLGDNAAASAILEKAVKSPGAGRIAWVDMGILEAGDHQNEQAVADFRRAIEMDPSEVDAHWRLARLYQSMGKKEEAKAEFAKANRLHEQKDVALVRQISGRPPANHP